MKNHRTASSAGRFIIRGPTSLRGEVLVSGAKNAALPIMAACLLATEKITLENVPRTADIATMERLLTLLGVACTWQAEHVLELQVVREDNLSVPDKCLEEMRASVCALGPLLARRGAAHLRKPGGCMIGPRPIDAHIKGLRSLGARIIETETDVVGSALRLKGNDVDLSVASGSTVLGTANVLCAAVIAEGRTTIRHAALEPEISALAEFLNIIGARVTGIGTACLSVEGVKELKGGCFTLPPDRIEAGTFLIAAAITGGDVLVRHAREEHLEVVLHTLEQMNCSVTEDEAGIRVNRVGALGSAEIITAPYPGFPTDLQPQLMALMCLASGQSRVVEGIFPSRLRHVEQLCKMGAAIELDRNSATINGVPRLQGMEVVATDLRAGAALVLAGLAADGVTIVQQAEYVARGYENLAAKLRSLGADINEEMEGD